MTPSLGSIHVLEGLTGHRETCSFLGRWLIVERESSGTARRKRHRARHAGKGTALLSPPQTTALPASPHIHQPGSSPNCLLFGFYGDFITQVWLIQSMAIGNQSLPQKSGAGLKLLTL